MTLAEIAIIMSKLQIQKSLIQAEIDRLNTCLDAQTKEMRKTTEGIAKAQAEMDRLAKESPVEKKKTKKKKKRDS